MSDLFTNDRELRDRLLAAGWYIAAHAGVDFWRSPEGELLVEDEARKRLEAAERKES